MRLSEVAWEGREIEDLLIEAEGELTPELESRLDALLAQGAEAMNAAAWVARKLTADADLCAEEAKRFTERRQSLEREIASLKARMLFAVDEAFGGKLKTPKNTIWGQTSGSTLSFDLAPDADIASLADEMPGIVRTTFSLDKPTLKTMHEQGKPIPAAVTVEEKPGTRFLRIK